MHGITPFILILSGFVAVLFTGAWLVSPGEKRSQVAAQLQARIRRSGAALAAGVLPLRSMLWRSQDLGCSLATRLHAQRKLLLILGAIVLTPVVIAVSLREHRTLEGFDDRVADRDLVIATLLHGEQLVPPPALPPEVFTTAEVELLRPSIGFASREWEKLDVDFQQRLLQIFKIMEERYGYRMALIEGYRSPERQAMLAAMGPHVTNAGAYQSYHQVGLGADCAFYRDGKLVISEKDPWAMRGYRLYGELAQAFGLTWGGNWKMLDFGHVELRKPGVLRRARAAAQ